MLPPIEIPPLPVLDGVELLELAPTLIPTQHLSFSKSKKQHNNQHGRAGESCDDPNQILRLDADVAAAIAGTGARRGRAQRTAAAEK